MVQVIGGHNLGLLDGSYTVLNRNDRTGRGTLGQGQEAFANVANGNLLFQERDIFLPSFGEDFNFVRTYNSRGVPNEAKGWWFSPNVSLAKHEDKLASTGKNQTNYAVTYGDGSVLEFAYNAGRGIWISTDGAGAFETLEVLPKGNPDPKDKEKFLITRADRSQYLFDDKMNLLSVTDANGVATTFEYKGKDVVKIRDDSGHVLSLNYQGGKLISVTDELNLVLVQYGYTGSLLTQVTDRYGHVTKYSYNKDKLLERITLPDVQTVNGITTQYAQRTLTFGYEKVKWDDHSHHHTDLGHGDEWVVTSITDSNGGMTTFEYNFLFARDMAANDRDLVNKPHGGNDFQGGTTRVVDALGNARAYSNEAEYVAWRVAKGYYATYTLYDPKKQAAQLAAQNATAELIRSQQAVTYAYDPNGQITRVTDELGFQTTYTYDFDGNLTSITDANGFGAANSDSAYYRALREELGFSALLSGLSAADKTALLARFTSTYTYDGNGNLLTSRDNAGNVTTYTYTAFNQVASITTALGHLTSFDYDANQNLIRRTDALGNITGFEYDANGNLVRKIVYLDKDDLITEATQQITVYSYDAWGNNISIADAEGHVTHQTFDHFGNLILSRDARGNQTAFVYDADNRLLSRTSAEGHTTSYAYDAVGNQIAVTDANGHTITRVFDKNNMLLSTIDSAANPAQTRTTQYLYDILGNGTKTTDAEGRVTTYAYDAHRQLVRIDSATVKDAADNDVSYSQTFAYDGESNTVTTTDRRGNSTQYLYTANGLVRRVTDANLNVTEYSYDADSRRIEIVIGAQLAVGQRRAVTFTYDDADQLVTVTDALGNVKQYSYDAPGNVVAVTDANGNMTEFAFDRNNRLLTETRPSVDVNGIGTRYVVTHAYDENGNEVSTTDENGHVTMLAYDRDDRLVLLTDANNIKTVFSYDSRDNRTKVAIGVAATYDSISGHVTITNTADGRVTTYTYDEFNQIVAKTDGVGNALVTSDDAAYQKMRVDMGEEALVGDLLDDAKARLLESFTEHYGYDRVGNRVLVRDHLDRDRLTEYDALDRIVAVTDGGGSLVRTTTYRYDGNDNLVKIALPLGRVSTMTYDVMDRVTYSEDAAHVITENVYDQLGNLIAQTRAYGTAAARTTQYSYDIRGRMTEQRSAAVHTSAGVEQSVVTQYGYDGEGNLASRTSAFGLAEQRVEGFEYDANGRLIAQVNGENERTEFVYDGVGNRIQITVAPDLPEERVNQFEYDAGGRLIAEIDGEAVRTEYLYDANGNRIEVTQAAGIAGERHTLMTYDAEGRLLSVVDPIGWARAYSDAAEFQAWRLANSFAETAAAVLLADQATTILDTRRTRYEYDELSNQARIIDAGGTVTENTFNEMGWLATNTVGVGGPNGGIRTTNTYDVFGNVLTSTQAWANGSGVSRTMAYQYDALDRQIRVTDGEGFSTLLDYDAFGNVTRIQRGAYLPSGTPDTAKAAAEHIYETLLAYDRMDRLLSTTDGRGNIVRNTYDALGNRLTQTTGLKTGAGLDVAHASELTYRYDRAGRMTERATAAGGLIRLTYDKAGNLTRQDTLQSGTVGGSPVWTTRTFVYDGNGRTTDSYDSYNTRTQYLFDAVGNQTGIVHAKGTVDERSVGFEYDLANNRTADIDGYGNRTLHAYDAVGNRTRQTDALGHVTRFYYDAFRQLTGQLDARSFLTTYVHDAAGNVTETRIRMTAVGGPVTDISPLPLPANAATDRVTTSVFDRANRVTQRTAPDGSSKTYEYDSTDKLVRLTQYGSTNATQAGKTALATPRVLTWQYDDSGRVALFTNVDGVTEAYTYDAANNKISETIHNPNPLPGGRTDPDRKTTFEYDLDNRLTRQLFDPASLQLQQLLAYDKAGNVVAKTDSNGTVTASRYDRENRITRVTDPLSNATNYAYDRIGNLVTVTNARGYALTLTYDLNNRVTQEVRAAVEVRHWVNGVNGSTLQTATVSPTTTTVYDAVGNAVQVTDARGNVTTRWYDATGNVIGELNGAAALRRYTYDATGALLAAALDLAPRTGETINLTTPLSLTLNTRVATNEYDLGGRVTRTVYSAIEVTTVDYTGASPTASVQTRAPEELNYYDAFGNLVESVDRNGKSSYAYYDLRGRVVASVDAAGYLIETDYDSQDNVVQQRRYKTRLAAGTSAVSRPVAPDVTPVTVDRIYDAAGRMTAQYSPLVRTMSGDVRVVNLFTYDGNGNMTSKTVASATISGATTTTNANSRTEYFFYDAAGRRRAVVGADRVLNVFTYDANGNLTSQKRHFNAIGAGFDLATATLATVLASTTANAAMDEETVYAYDNADRMITRTDLMTGGNLIDRSGYDENGNRTWGENADGYETSTRHDAMGQIVEMITPNGSHSHIAYDTGGLKVSAWISGATGSAAPPATAFGARIANVAGAPLVISWDQTGTGMTSWVAWDTQSRAGTNPPSPAPGVGGVYANASGPNVGTGSLSTAIALTAGQNTIYFRIVSRDAFGNLAWTAEQSVSVPTRVESMTIGQSGTNFVATIRFDAAVTSATLRLADGTLPSGVVAVPSNGDAANGYTTWTFTFTGVKSDRFRIEWQKGGVTYQTDSIPLLEAPGIHADAGDGWVTWPIPQDSTAAVGNGQFILVNGVLQPPANSIRTITGQLNFQPPALANGATSAYDVLYGMVSAETHSASITFTQRLVAHATGSSGNPWVYAWNSPQDAALTNVSVTLASTETSRVPAGAMRVSYRTAGNGTGGFTPGATATMASNTFSASLALAAGDYDIKVWYLDGTGKEVIVEWRRVTVPAVPALPPVPPSVPEANAHPDITTTRDVGPAQNFSGGRSLVLLAQETGGQIARAGSGDALTVVAGTYIGPVNPGTSNLLLNPAVTAQNTGGSKTSNGLLAQTYYTQIEYNALGVKIATNEDSGLWRVLGVDANGNVVQTSLYGTQQAQIDDEDAIITFKAYDERGLEIARYGADLDPGSADVRAITLTTYDYAGKVVKVVDPGNTDAQGRTFTYDDVGNRIGSTDAMGNGQMMAYNVFGQLVSQTDARGNIRRKDYDSIGRLTEEYVQGQAGNHRYYAYDAFGRRIQVARGGGVGLVTRAADGKVSGNVTALTATYDQRDRVTSVTDGLSKVTRYMYDGRDNLIWTQDANSNWFGARYDGMGQVSHRYSFQTRWTDASGNHVGTAPTDFAGVTAALNGSNAGFAATLRVQTMTYDAFTNKISETDAAGRVRSFDYGAFGRLAATTNGDLVTTFTYDRYGNKQAEASSYGKNIAYAYDAAGRLTYINDIGTNTSTTYTYDVAGRRATEVLQKAPVGSSKTTWHSYTYVYNANGWTLSWRDTTTGIGAVYAYDAVGNVSSVQGLKTGSTVTNVATGAVTAPLFTHAYTYDAFDRVVTAVGDGYAHDDLDGTGDSYTYDDRGRRLSWTHDGTTTTYTYDDADRVTNAGNVTWMYDSVGNVTSVGNGTPATTTTYSYDTNNVSYTSVSDSTSTTFFDKSGRVMTTQTVSGDSTYTYTHAYNADGTEKSVSASGTGDVTGSSVSTYDVNGNLVHIDLGQGDDAPLTAKDFYYDNQGHIVKATLETTKNYLYANDKPVGEYADTDPANPTLNTGAYSVLRSVPGAYGTAAPDFPVAAVNEHVVAAGDTLQSIAGALYGHPELWFVIADANGLTGSEQLPAGMRLIIPNSVQYAGFTSQTHALYNEGEIVGSKLPNLKSPPPPAKDDCAVIGAIIAIVVVTLIAVVATVLTAGALGPAAFAAVAGTYGAVAGVIAGVLVAAAVGAVIAFAASALTQVILVESGLQEEFDWKAVAADTAAGAFSGAAVGLGAIVGTVTKVTTIIRVASVIAQTALEVGGEITRQVIVNGHVNDWTGVAIAGGTAALGSVGDLAETTKEVNKAAAKVVKLEHGVETAVEAAAKSTKLLDRLADTAKAAGSAVANTVGGAGRRAEQAAVAGQRIADGFKQARGVESVLNALDAINSVAKTAAKIEKGAKYTQRALIAANLAWGQLDKNRSEVVGRQSSFQIGSAGAAGRITGLARIGVSVSRAVLNTNQAISGPDRQPAPSAASASRAAQSAFIDSPTVAAYALENKRQHQWAPTSWVDAAASSITQIMSQFPGVPSLGTTLHYNRLLAGETARFSSSSIAGFAAGTVGHVASNPVPLPIIVLNNAAPNPFG